MSFLAHVVTETTVKVELPPAAPCLLSFQRARTRERNRAILAIDAVVHYMSDFAALGVPVLNSTSTLTIPQFNGLPSDLTGVPPGQLTSLLGGYSNTFVNPPSTGTTTQTTQGTITYYNTTINNTTVVQQTTTPTSQIIIVTSKTATVQFLTVYLGNGNAIQLPQPPAGTVIKSISITNQDSSNPLFVNGVVILAQQTVTFSADDPNAQIDPSTIVINNPNNVTYAVNYEIEKQ